MNLLRSGLLFLFGFTACDNAEKQSSTPDDSSKISIASIKLLDLEDQAIDLSKYKDKTVFVNFWATWCKPCREEMPSIRNAMAILKNEPIEFLFASEESKEEIEEFKATLKYDFNFVRAENLSELNIIGLPTTFIFNADGELVFSETGFRKWDDETNIDLINNILKSK